MSGELPVTTGWPGSVALVGSYSAATGRHFLPITEREISRATEAADRVLASFDLARGAAVVLVSLMDEAAHMLPLTDACVERGLVVCSTDASETDAARLESVIRRFCPVAVFGIGQASLLGLAALGFDAAALFARAHVWARPDAYGALAAKLPNIYRWVEVGPTLALECTAREGVHVDGREWVVEDEGGSIRISNRLPRRTAFDRLDTGLRAVRVGGVCRCGNADPLIRVVE